MATNNISKKIGEAELSSTDYSMESLLDDFIIHLQINDQDSEGVALTTYLQAAIDQFEFSTQGRAVFPTVYRQSVVCWDDMLRLEAGDVLSVTEIAYYDQENELQTEDEADWFLDSSAVPALLYRLDRSYPAVSSQIVRPISVEFIAGFDVIPEDVKLSIMLLASTYYSYRESHLETELKALPLGFQAIANKYHTGLGVI